MTNSEKQAYNLDLSGDSATSLDGAEWRKSTFSGDNGQCVEVATNLPGIIAVRDSKNPTGPALRFTPGEWNAFLQGVNAGEFS